jgi:hypothetical protein
MGSPLLTATTQLQCVHGGQATPLVSNPRVSIMQARLLTVVAACSVAGCSLPPPAGGPCATATWGSPATRITASGLPLLLSTSVATTVPTGTTLLVVPTQARVMGE